MFKSNPKIKTNHVAREPEVKTKKIIMEKENAKEIKEVQEEKVVNVLIDKSEVVPKAEPKLEPLQPGQKYFETPDGEIIIGESTKQQIWVRRLNNNAGGWVNPKR